MELSANPSLAQSQDKPQQLRPLRMLSVYRLLVSMLILGSITSGLEGLLIGIVQPGLFLQLSMGYFAFSLVALLVALQLEGYVMLQACVHTLVDTVVLAALIYAAGPENAALGALMVVAVAGGATLVPTRLALLFAAVGTIGLLFQHWLHTLRPEVISISYTPIGLLGMVLFIISLTGNVMAKRIRTSEALAEKRGVDLANQEALNRHIVQRLQDGVLVLDEQDRVRLMNNAAWEHLGKPGQQTDPPLQKLTPALADHVRRWRVQGDTWLPPLSLVRDGDEVQARILTLGSGRRGGVLIFLEDLAELKARVQQVKLVSLGRLSANIAHEIRNPLSAMMHAAQLLEESELPPADQRLLTIVQQQGQRLNGIIESVLGLSRREQPRREVIPLKPWLEQFIESLKMQRELQHINLELSSVPSDLKIRFDAGHLDQVVGNLVGNAAMHAQPVAGQPMVSFSAGTDVAGNVWLDIKDNGPGIPQGKADQLFEPFFTTSRQGTGLGLYLCRELCESNQARLSLRDSSDKGACFRITGTAVNA
ncbi:MAG: PAS domain-containing protein [Ectothiorhodospiraceae bacterium]|nr:PAS domain-containing protein [Ectothiorhodospiraceae bacterium]MCH8505850.1 hypothetical protein [Ectothiorhodospiraceae bacterium]